MLLDRQRLSHVLDVLNAASGNKIVLVANYFLFQVSKANQLLLISSTDFKAFIAMNFGDIALSKLDDVPASFLLPADKLTSLVKSSTTKDIEFTGVETEGFITVKANGTYKLNKYDDPQNTSFPSVTWECQPLGVWSANQLRDIWSKVSIALSKDVTKAAYQCVNYDGNWVATDNRRLAIIQSEAGITQKPGFLLLPNFGNIIKHCESEQISLGYTEDRRTVVLRDDSIGMLASFRLIDDEFLNYPSLLTNKNPFVKLTLNRSEFLGILNRLDIFINKDHQFCDLVIEKQNNAMVLRCSIMNRDGGTEYITPISYEGPAEADDSGEVLNFSYHIGNIRDAVNTTTNQEKVAISFGTDGKLYLDENLAGSNFSYLLGKVEK